MISIKGFRAACCRLTDIGVLFSGVRGGGVPTGTRRSAPDAGVTVAGGGNESAGLAYCFCKTLFHCWTINLSEGLPLACKQNKNHPRFQSIKLSVGQEECQPMSQKHSDMVFCWLRGQNKHNNQCLLSRPRRHEKLLRTSRTDIRNIITSLQTGPHDYRHMN